MLQCPIFIRPQFRLQHLWTTRDNIDGYSPYYRYQRYKSLCLQKLICLILGHYSLYGYQHMPYSLHHMHGAFQILLRRHIQDRAICLSLSHSVAFLLFLLRPYRSIISLSTLPALDLSGRVPTIQLIFFSDSFHSLDF